MFLREQSEVNMTCQSIVKQIYTKYLVFRKYNQEKLRILIFEKLMFGISENQMIIIHRNVVSSKIGT